MSRSHLFALACCAALPALTWADEQRHRDSQRLNAPPASEDVGKPDLNTADVAALEAVPVIGPDGARAIIAARPFRTLADLDRIRGLSAERLEQIRSQVRLSTPAPATPRVDRAKHDASARKVDLNTADLATLSALPAIGPETARALIAARPFRTLDDLSRVPGLSAERLEQIRAQVTVAPSPLPREKSAPQAPVR